MTLQSYFNLLSIKHLVKIVTGPDISIAPLCLMPPVSPSFLTPLGVDQVVET